MTARQLAILNALVTYTAENVPLGLTEDEREVARIVGRAALLGNPMELTVEEEGMDTAPEYPTAPAWLLPALFMLAAGIAVGITIAGGWS